jgi:hypothetical protein
LVLSDVSPSDTLLLLSSWGVRPCLAYQLVEVYGGHILQISRALENLYHEKENAEITICASSQGLVVSWQFAPKKVKGRN